VDLLEYQARELFAAHEVPVPAGAVADNADEARFAAALLHEPVVVKAQVPAGGRGKAGGVRLADGRLLAADLVLVGIGLEPRTELAGQIGLEVAGGIVVDSCARTSNPAVVAAGDCTTLPHPLTGAGRLRIESVQNAIAQAQAAAASLLGRPSATRAVPWFWSDQGDLKLQIAGLSHGYDQVVVRGTPESERFSVLYYAAGQLIAADAVNAPRDYMTARKVLGAGGTLPADRAADASVALKDLITTPVVR